MWKITRLCVLCLCPGFLALAGCSGSQTADATKAKAEAEAAKTEVAQVKSELAQVKSELAKHRAAQETGRYQLGTSTRSSGDKGVQTELFILDTKTGRVAWRNNNGGSWGYYAWTEEKVSIAQGNKE
jgi:hypothetical protein